MNRNDVNWQGPFTAVHTPFTADGAIDETGLRQHVDWLIGHGIQGIVANGCTGEFWAQTMDERKRVVRIVLEAAAKRVPVLGGSGAPATRDVIELCEFYKSIGCDGVMIMPPYMVHPKKEDIYLHFKAISDSVAIPIMLYNNPSDVGNDLPLDLIKRLVELDHVVAIKDSTFDYNAFWHLQCAVSDRIRILIGPATMFGAAAIHMGADGWVDTYSNVWPAMVMDLYAAAKSGDASRARRMQKIGSEFRGFLLHPEWNMYCAVKAAMNLLGLPGGYPRPPLRPLTGAHLTRLREGLTRFGVPGATQARGAA